MADDSRTPPLGTDESHTGALPEVAVVVPPPATDDKRSAAAKQLRDAAKQLRDAADRLSHSTRQSIAKLHGAAAKLRTAADPRPVRTLLEQPEDDRSEDAHIRQLKAIEDRLRQLEAVVGRLDVVAGRPEAAAADRFDAVAVQLDAVADRLEAVAVRLEAHADPLVVASDPLFAAATLLRSSAYQIEKFSSHRLLSAAAAGSIGAAAGQLRAIVVRLPSASQLRACANQLSAAAGLVSVPAAAHPLTAAAHELLRVLGEHPTAPPGQHRTARTWDAAVLQLRSLVYELQYDADEIQKISQSLTEADANIVQIRHVQQIVQDVRGHFLSQLCEGNARGNDKVIPSDQWTLYSNLVDIDSNPRLKKAREQWLQTSQDLSKSMLQHKAASVDVRNQIYNLIGWYAVYLGVVLSIVTQLAQNSDKEPVCGIVWVPICLTLIGMFVIIGGVIFKFMDIFSLVHTIEIEKQYTQDLEDRITALKLKGLGFDFLKDIRECWGRRPPYNRKKYLAVIVAMIAPAVMFMISYYAILCDKWRIRQWD